MSSTLTKYLLRRAFEWEKKNGNCEPIIPSEKKHQNLSFQAGRSTSTSTQATRNDNSWTVDDMPREFRWEDASDLLPCCVIGLATEFRGLSQDARDIRPLRIGKHSFASSILRSKYNRDCEVQLLFDHNDAAELASTVDGTLTIASNNEGPDGLCGILFKARLPRTKLGRDVAKRIASGELWGCSIGYIRDDYSRSRNGRFNILANSRLFEISLTDSPAFRGTWCRLEPLPIAKLMNDIHYMDELKFGMFT